MKRLLFCLVFALAAHPAAAKYVGDYAPGTIIDACDFYTHTSAGAPATLSGTPAVSVYKSNSTTQSTAGVTLSVDFDSVTGLNHVRVDTSADGTFYAAPDSFRIVITTGTVSGTSVVGSVPCVFTLNHVSGLRPTVAGRTLDVTAAGEAGLDLDNTAGGLAKGTEITGFNDLSAAQVNTEADTALADVGLTTTVTGRIDAATSTRASQASLDTVDDFVDTEVAAIKAKTDQLTFTNTNKVDSAILAEGDFAQAAADKAWASSTRTLTAFSFLSASDVWNHGARTLTACSFCLTAGQVENAVWDATAASHNTAGSTGNKLNSAASAGDPWNTALPGAYGAGTAGNLLGNLAPSTFAATLWSYASRTLTGTSSTVVVVSPTGTAGTLALTRNDSYYAADGPIPSFTRKGWIDLTTATEIRLTVRRRPSTGTGVDPVHFTVTDRAASRAGFGTAEQTVAFELASTDTDDLVPGPGTGKYDIQVTLANGHVRTLESGLVNVTEDQTRP